MSATHNRFDALDGLRGVAAIAVMISHFSQETVFKNAYEAVDLFFMLSGFVIAHSYGVRLLNGMTSTEYVSRRLIRLYPMLLISLLIALPVFIEAGAVGLSNYSVRNVAAATLDNFFLAPYLGDFGAASMTSIQSVPPAQLTIAAIFPSNPPAWSLFFEVLASLAFAFVVRLSTRSIFKIIVFSAVMFVVFSALTVVETHGHGFADFEQGWSSSRLDGGFFRIAFGFMAGVFLYNVKSASAKPVRAMVPRVFANIYVLYALVLVLFLFPMSLRGLYPMLIIFCVAPWLVLFGSTVQCTSPVEIQIARFLGWLSYPVYLLHYPIGQAVYMVTGTPNASAPAPMLVASAITIVSAIILTKFVEEPVRNFLSKRFVGRSTAVPVISLDAATLDASILSDQTPV
ncbi:acyltransferase family protein [Caballeronia sp. 15715]|uniref:acyltransferase family protein n=1 Tax=Caballeronia sp. 15715 TaxID=3391030 RepID=UPI0039E59FB0